MERSVLMKVFLKKFGVIVAAASILFAFSACSDSNGTGNPDKTSSTTTTQTDSTDTSTTSTYVIESIVGNVTYECAPNTFAKVWVGQELSASTVINVGLNSSVVIKCGGKSVTIPSKQLGTVEVLCAGV